MIPELDSLLVFVTAGFTLLVIPGPAVTYIVARSLEQGRRAGIVSTLGISLGSFFHVFTAAIGLSALVMQSALAFNVIKYAGAAYLLYIGVRTLMRPIQQVGQEEIQPRPLRRLLGQGFIVNLLNPKAALFFLAFLPQFVDPERGPVMWQVLFLGSLFTLMGMTTDTVYALAAGTVRDHLSSSVGSLRRRRNLTGLTYVVLGVFSAVSGSSE